MHLNIGSFRGNRLVLRGVGLSAKELEISPKRYDIVKIRAVARISLLCEDFAIERKKALNMSFMHAVALFPPVS
jgi:16S rRNA G527 N7-methylase RsmG